MDEHHFKKGAARARNELPAVGPIEDLFLSSSAKHWRDEGFRDGHLAKSIADELNTAFGDSDEGAEPTEITHTHLHSHEMAVDHGELPTSNLRLAESNTELTRGQGKLGDAIESAASEVFAGVVVGALLNGVFRMLGSATSLAISLAERQQEDEASAELALRPLRFIRLVENLENHGALTLARIRGNAILHGFDSEEAQALTQALIGAGILKRIKRQLKVDKKSAAYEDAVRRLTSLQDEDT